MTGHFRENTLVAEMIIKFPALVNAPASIVLKAGVSGGKILVKKNTNMLVYKKNNVLPSVKRSPIAIRL